jgi:hypothetical protein
VGVAVKDLKGKVKRPVRSVAICLDGDLWARHDELTQKLDELGTKSNARMGQSNGTAEIAQEITEVEAAMRDASVSIQIRGIGTYHLKEIQRGSRPMTRTWRGMSMQAPPHCWQPAWWSPPPRTRRVSSSRI